MPVKSAGETYNLNDTCILQINSPRDSVRGPYVVAYHTPPDGERWAVVALDWDGRTRLESGGFGVLGPSKQHWLRNMVHHSGHVS